MSASLTVALNHTIAYLLSPLEATYPRSTLLSLADALHSTLTPRLARHWSSPSRSARVLSFSPASLPPKAILDAFNATATNWQLAIHKRASGRDFDIFVDPGCVSVSIAGAQRFTIWSEAPLTSAYKPSTQELLAFDDDDELFSLIDKQVLSRSSLSAPSCADPAHAVDQLADMLSLFPSVPLTSTAFSKHNGVHLSAFHHSRTTSASSSVPSLSHSRSSSSTSATSSLSRSSSSSSLGENPHYNVNHPALLRLKALRDAKANKAEDAFLPPRLVLPVTPPQAAAAAAWPAYSPSTPSISPQSSVQTIPSPITPLSSLSGRNGSSSSLEFTSVVTPATPTAPCGPSSPSKAPAAAKPKRNRRQRVHVDASRIVPVRYEGGRTTVLTGGTMLGPRSV